MPCIIFAMEKIEKKTEHFAAINQSYKRLVVRVLTVWFGFLWRFYVKAISQSSIERRAGSIHCTPEAEHNQNNIETFTAVLSMLNAVNCLKTTCI